MNELVYTTCIPDPNDESLRNKFWVEVYLEREEQVEDPTYTFQVWKEEVTMVNNQESMRISGKFKQGGFKEIFPAMVKLVQHINRLTNVTQTKNTA